MKSLWLPEETMKKPEEIMRDLAQAHPPAELALAGDAMFAKGGCNCGGGCKGSCQGQCGGCGGSSCKGGLKIF